MSPYNRNYSQACRKWMGLMPGCKMSMCIEESLFNALSAAVAILRQDQWAVEFGSGISTLAMQDGPAPVVSHESDPHQATIVGGFPGVTCHFRPIDPLTEWYTITNPTPAGVLLIDGPWTRDGSRLAGLDDILRYCVEDTVVFVDDVHRHDELLLCHRLAERLNRTPTYRDRWAVL